VPVHCEVQVRPTLAAVGAVGPFNCTAAGIGSVMTSRSGAGVCHERGRLPFGSGVIERGAVQEMKVWPFDVALRGEASNHLMLR
jgi:hypothetical protein